jgi:hypothetical protein
MSLIFGWRGRGPGGLRGSRRRRCRCSRHSGPRWRSLLAVLAASWSPSPSPFYPSCAPPPSSLPPPFSFTSFLAPANTHCTHRSGQPRLLRAVQALGCGLEDGVALGKNGSKNGKGKATAKAKGGGKWEIELDCLVGLSSCPVGCRMGLMCLFSLLAFFSFVDPISRIPDAPPSRLRLIRFSRQSSLRIDPPLANAYIDLLNRNLHTALARGVPPLRRGARKGTAGVA